MGKQVGRGIYTCGISGRTEREDENRIDRRKRRKRAEERRLTEKRRRRRGRKEPGIGGGRERKTSLSRGRGRRSGGGRGHMETQQKGNASERNPESQRGLKWQHERIKDKKSTFQLLMRRRYSDLQDANIWRIIGA